MPRIQKSKLDIVLPSRNPNISFLYIQILTVLSAQTKVLHVQNITSHSVVVSKSHWEVIFKSSLSETKSSLLFPSEVEKCQIWELKWTLGKMEKSVAYKADFERVLLRNEGGRV